MQETLQYLTQINPPRNYQNLASLNRVANYLKSRFEFIGLEVQFQEYEADKNIYKNVIASLNTKYKKRLIVGAHYDVCGDTQGANDNASAVAGVIQTAKQLFNFKDKINFRIDFVCFTLEEPPFFYTDKMGSFIHAKYLKTNNINVIGMINYEMIGYFSDEPNSQDYPLPMMKMMYPNKGNFIACVSNEKSKSFLDEMDFKSLKNKLDTINITLPSTIETLTASDHLNYWNFGYKAVMITDTEHFRNKNYHTMNDTIETLDIEKMGYVVDIVVDSILNLKV